MSTRAAVLHNFGEPLSIEEIPLPSKLEPGSLLVHVDCCTLCGSDAHLWEGKITAKGVVTPIVPGHEMMGQIVAMEPSGQLDALGRRLREGDRIVWTEASCGHCYDCSVLQQPVMCSNRRFGIRQRADQPPYAIGGLVDHCYVEPGSPRLLLGDDIKDTWAAASGCALKTVVRAFERAGSIGAGTTVVIQGSGPLGLFATAMAVSRGARQVITIGAPELRLDLARRWGATELVSIDKMPTVEQRVARVLELTGRGADLVMDFAGAPTSTVEGILMAAKHGRHMVVGTISPSPLPIPNQLIMQKELTIVGSTPGDIGTHHRAIEFLREFGGRFDWDAMFSPPVELADAMPALEAMVRMTAIKAVVKPRG
jgi:threonine dehydrogenase-like Zn-dependent dehydrogenase